jgi:hypothetical protein
MGRIDFEDEHELMTDVPSNGSQQWFAHHMQAARCYGKASSVASSSLTSLK